MLPSETGIDDRPDADVPPAGPEARSPAYEVVVDGVTQRTGPPPDGAPPQSPPRPATIDEEPTTSAVVHTAALTGLDATVVRVEASNQGGLPGMRIIGLPDTAVREAVDRLASAFKHHGIKVPERRFVVNLAPAALRKQGGGFDLPLALALLATTKQFARMALGGVWAFGEIGLDGSCRPTRGTLSVADAARRAGARRLLVPEAVAREAALVPDLDVVAVSTLADAVGVLLGRQIPARVLPAEPVHRSTAPDLRDVRGQEIARRALEIAAAGDHHLLLVGPPGCGKSMLARRLPGLLPPLALDDALRNAAVRSVAGLRQGDEPLDLTPPFRDPHHATSAAGLIGGGSGVPRPGELSLAHGGVLFLDELLETPRHVLDALREPLETGEVTLVRAAGTVRYPARVQLVAATNPCPCGMLGSAEHACRCRPDQVSRYRGRLSGPLLDRLDVHVQLVAVPHDQLVGRPEGEPSEAVAARVAAARRLMVERWGVTNRRVEPDVLRTACSAASERRLADAVRVLGLSARAFDRCLRVARTIADIAGVERVEPEHVDEAVALRLAPTT